MGFGNALAIMLFVLGVGFDSSDGFEVELRDELVSAQLGKNPPNLALKLGKALTRYVQVCVPE